MMASLSTHDGQAAEAQLGFGIVLTEDTERSSLHPQRGSPVQVRVELPLFCTGKEIESVVVRSRTSWSLIGPRHTEYWLELSLHSDAAMRLAELSRRQIDVRLALLVRGEAVGVIALGSPIAGSKVSLYGFSDRSAAEALKDEITTALKVTR